MINKFLKNINNKYSVVFKFIFFLRYLFVIFFVSSALFLIIPKFFNYEKKIEIFNNYLFKNYDLRINQYDQINYYILPVPKIEIKNVETEFNQISSSLLTQSIILYPKLLSIYNYDNFETKKIVFNKNQLNLEVSEFYVLVKNILKQKKKFSLKNLNLKLYNKNNFLINLQNINFTNYGYNKNIFFGKIFNKKFKSEFNENLNKVKINISDIGFQSDIKFNKIKENLIKGNAKIKLSNTNLKFDFLYSNKKFEIFNSFFRSKNLSFKNKSLITLDPYFETEANFVIDDINIKLLKKLDFEKFFSFKNIIKKVNSKNEISFKSKKFSRVLINELNLKIDLSYGRLNFNKLLTISDINSQCSGVINLLEEFPLLDFNCKISTLDKKKFLKIFNIKYKNKNEILDLNVNGNINILSNKISFKNIKTNNYQASKEDLKYFKDMFENIVLNDNFSNIFDLRKIKNFILEIS